jgi:sulfur-oxidizing protein SoxY
MNNSRRVALKTTGAFATLVSLGIITQSQAQAAVDRTSFQVKTLEDALKAIGGTAATSDQVSVVSPDIAENGAVVPVGATSKLPNTTEIYLIV